MKKIKIPALFTLLMMLCTSIAFAQVKPLQKGEELPQIAFADLYNTESVSLTTADLKGKIIIIDFWNKWCTSCINGLNKMEKLQEKYKDDIIILPVTDHPRDVVSKFWKANPITKKLKLPTIVNDSVLNKLFPHVGVPHIVWINKSGRYLSSTSSEYANEKEIENLIQGTKVDWIEKKSLVTYDFSKRLLISNIAVDSSRLFYSGFLPYSGEFRKSGTEIMIDTLKRIVRITSINNTIIGLYFATLQRYPLLRYPKMRQINVRDTTRLKYNKADGYISKWRSKNTYNYELFWPLGNTLETNESLEKMRSDLDAYMHYKSDIKIIPSKQLILAKTKAIERKIFKINSKHRESIPITDLIDRVNFDELSLPLIINNYTLETDKLMIDYSPEQKLDINVLNAMLAAKGFVLKEEIHEQPLFVLQDW